MNAPATTTPPSPACPPGDTAPPAGDAGGVGEAAGLASGADLTLARSGGAGSGPVVWGGIIAATCLLLYACQSILWLVVPFLLALLLHYALQPLARRLMFAGLAPERAAALVAGGFFVAAAAIALVLGPWLLEQATAGEALFHRYAEGGRLLLENSLRSLEQRVGFFAEARLSARVGSQLSSFSATLAEKHLPALVMGLATWLPALMLAPFFAFFFLRDGLRFKRFIARAVPNAFFERSLYLLHRVDRTARAYFLGLLKLTVLDAACLAAGLWLIGMPGPLLLGVVTAVLAWIPYVGSIAGCLLVVLVAATDFPADPAMAYWAIGLFVAVRLLDDFVFMPLTIGRSLHMHPLLTVIMIFVGGAIAGVTGLMLVLPLLGVVMVVGETLGKVITDPRLRARHAHARRLQAREVNRDLDL